MCHICVHALYALVSNSSLYHRSGFTGSFGYTKYVHVANYDGAPMSLSMFVGGGLGMLLSTFVLMVFKPKLRVVTNSLLMILGVLFSWFLPMPANVYLGYGFLYMGQFGLQVRDMYMRSVVETYAIHIYLILIFVCSF